MNTPYRTKKGILIGSNYSKKVNYHNEDQDWIQRIALGEKNSYTIGTVVTWTMWALVVYAIAGLLSPVSITRPFFINWLYRGVIELDLY